MVRAETPVETVVGDIDGVARARISRFGQTPGGVIGVEPAPQLALVEVRVVERGRREGPQDESQFSAQATILKNNLPTGGGTEPGVYDTFIM